jgi:hypothetical protein
VRLFKHPLSRAVAALRVQGEVLPDTLLAQRFDYFHDRLKPRHAIDEIRSYWQRSINETGKNLGVRRPYRQVLNDARYTGPVAR